VSAVETAGVLECRGVSRQFGAVVACDDVSLHVPPGEVHGLLGQNGAGKSTLMKIVAGVLPPDRGSVAVLGTPLPPGDPAAAARAGVGMVHQHFSLVRSLEVWKNVTLGERGAVLDASRIADEVAAIGDRYGLDVDPRAVVEELTPGQRQRVEIIKCLRRDPRLVVLDEPTSVLSRDETRQLFEVLRRLVRDDRRAVVLISHRLEEILDATDRVSIMRDGRLVTSIDTEGATPAMLAREMLGRSVSLFEDGAAVGGVTVIGAAPAVRHHEAPAVQPALELRDVVVTGRDGHRQLDGLSLAVRPGEILGIAGVEGNGQTPLVDLLSNLVTPDAGTVLVADRPVRAGHGRSIMRAGVGVIPADRHDSGCVLGMSVAENLALGRLHAVGRRGVINRRALFRRAAELVEEFGISAASLDAPLWSLSGGNQQRVVLARELAGRPRVLVAAQPTQGLDVGAMEYMWDRLRQTARDGCAVLLISTELDEVLALSDRVAVIQRGRIVGEMAGDAVDVERLGLLMGGHAA
jgi:simple sugar transport system ATP-binding protein